MLWLYPGSSGVKTGFTAGAGYCLIATAERDGRRLVAIVLGDRNEPFSEAAMLLDHGFEGYREETFVRAGEAIGTVAIRGGTVPVEAQRAITALVPTARLDHVQERVVVSPRAVFPPAAGERVGTFKITIPGVSLGPARSSSPPSRHRRRRATTRGGSGRPTRSAGRWAMRSMAWSAPPDRGARSPQLRRGSC